jgi:RNA polymerase sigma-70 factor (ECF subfamily)
MDGVEIRDIIRRYERPLLRFFRRNVIDETDAEDLTQEALLGIYLSGKRYRGDSSLSTWIYAIARNKLRNYYRSTGYRKITERLTDGIPDIERNAIRRLTLNLLIEGLDPEDRLLYERFYIRRIPIGEISALMKIPAGTVKYRLFLLRRRLQDRA